MLNVTFTIVQSQISFKMKFIIYKKEFEKESLVYDTF